MSTSGEPPSVEREESDAQLRQLIQTSISEHEAMLAEIARLKLETAEAEAQTEAVQMETRADQIACDQLDSQVKLLYHEATFRKQNIKRHKENYALLKQQAKMLEQRVQTAEERAKQDAGKWEARLAESQRRLDERRAMYDGFEWVRRLKALQAERDSINAELTAKNAEIARVDAEAAEMRAFIESAKAMPWQRVCVELADSQLKCRSLRRQIDTDRAAVAELKAQRAENDKQFAVPLLPVVRAQKPPQKRPSDVRAAVSRAPSVSKAAVVVSAPLPPARTPTPPPPPITVVEPQRPAEAEMVETTAADDVMDVSDALDCSAERSVLTVSDAASDEPQSQVHFADPIAQTKLMTPSPDVDSRDFSDRSTLSETTRSLSTYVPPQPVDGTANESLLGPLMRAPSNALTPAAAAAVEKDKDEAAMDDPFGLFSAAGVASPARVDTDGAKDFFSMFGLGNSPGGASPAGGDAAASTDFFGFGNFDADTSKTDANTSGGIGFFGF